MPADSADLPFFLGTTTNRTRKRRRPLALRSHPNVQHRIQICHGSRRIVSFDRAHLPLVWGSFSMNRQTRRLVDVEPEREVAPLLELELPEEPLRLQPDRLAGRDRPAGYVARILLGDRGIRPRFDRHIDLGR
jgi:hypothetical protein